MNGNASVSQYIFTSVAHWFRHRLLMTRKFSSNEKRFLGYSIEIMTMLWYLNRWDGIWALLAKLCHEVQINVDILKNSMISCIELWTLLGESFIVKSTFTLN